MIMTNRKHKTIRLCALTAALVFLLSACGDTGSGQEISSSGTQENEQAGSNVDGSRILIAYFTAAENSGVDAVSSASYTIINDEAVGRVRAVADMIQAQTGGELFSIRTSTVYPADGGELIDQAADEQDADIRPELTSHIENLDAYDVIFVGYAGGIIGLN